MIFDNNYDRVLWLIIKNDKSNRDRIISFIKSIPEDFVIRIQNTLVEYNKYKLDNENIPFYKREYRSFHFEMNYGEEYLYSFNVDIENDCLYVSRNRLRCAAYFSDFKLILKNYDSNNKELFMTQEIGGISYDHGNNFVSPGVVYSGSCTDIGYSVMNILCNNLLLLSSDNKGNFRMCGINNREIPILEGREDINSKLVRRRKRNTGKDKYDI